MADFILAWHPEDIELNGIPITNVEHADDVMTASGAPSGLQSHLNEAQRWANNNGCETSIPKCLGQVFGRVPKEHLMFHLGGKPITLVKKACYLGVWFETGSKFIWKEQYRVKAQKAATVANVILGLDRFVGKLSAWDARTLYMARIDPYLTAGCDSLASLERVQVKFLRRMLGVGRRSLTVVLFSETGIWPIKYRRVYLALNLDEARPASNALRDSLALAQQQKLCWINDLRIVLSRLYVSVPLDTSGDLDVKTVEQAMSCVKKSMEAWIDHEIESSHRVKDILVGRMEMDTTSGTLVKKSLEFRHYLRIASPEHRKALTKMVLSSHSLAVERRRWKERGKKIVPIQWRLCRFCYAYIEDPAHAFVNSIGFSREH
ncbi:hypothetical protein B0H12DRAFT_1205960 [Mycena haematopus]|nr:hypothetical protein B0H12DRAFT_1205960 [Mycena haematopus]